MLLSRRLHGTRRVLFVCSFIFLIHFVSCQEEGGDEGGGPEEGQLDVGVGEPKDLELPEEQSVESNATAPAPHQLLFKKHLIKMRQFCELRPEVVGGHHNEYDAIILVNVTAAKEPWPNGTEAGNYGQIALLRVSRTMDYKFWNTVGPNYPKPWPQAGEDAKNSIGHLGRLVGSYTYRNQTLLISPHHLADFDHKERKAYPWRKIAIKEARDGSKSEDLPQWAGILPPFTHQNVPEVLKHGRRLEGFYIPGDENDEDFTDKDIDLTSKLHFAAIEYRADGKFKWHYAILNGKGMAGENGTTLLYQHQSPLRDKVGVLPGHGIIANGANLGVAKKIQTSSVYWFGKGWYYELDTHSVLPGVNKEDTMVDYSSVLPPTIGYLRSSAEWIGCPPNFCITAEIDAAGVLPFRSDKTVKDVMIRGFYYWEVDINDSNPPEMGKNLKHIMDWQDAFEVNCPGRATGGNWPFRIPAEIEAIATLYDIPNQQQKSGSLIFGKPYYDGSHRRSGTLLTHGPLERGKCPDNYEFDTVVDLDLGADLIVGAAFTDPETKIIHVFYGNSLWAKFNATTEDSGEKVKFNLLEKPQPLAALSGHLPARGGVDAVTSLKDDDRIFFIRDNWVYIFDSFPRERSSDEDEREDDLGGYPVPTRQLIMDSDLWQCKDHDYVDLPANLVPVASMKSFADYMNKHAPETAFKDLSGDRAGYLLLILLLILAVLAILSFIGWIFLKPRAYTELQLGRIIDYLETQGLMKLDGTLPPWSSILNLKLPLKDIAEGRIDKHGRRVGPSKSKSISQSKSGSKSRSRSVNNPVTIGNTKKSSPSTSNKSFA